MANATKKYGKVLWKFICSILIWILLTFTLVPFFLVLYSIRFVSSKLVPLFYQRVTKILSTGSAPLALKDHESNIQAVICFGFEGKIELEDLRSTFETRVVQKKRSNGQLQWPELQQFIVHKFGFPFWRWDPSFNIQKHVRMLDLDPKFSQSGPNPQELLDIIEADLIHKPFKPKQSPWELLVVPNFHDTPNYGSENDVGRVGGTLLIFHFHHAFGDGTPIAKIFDELFNGEAEDQKTLTANTIKVSSLFSSWNTLKLYFLGPYEVITSGISMSKYAWITNPKIQKYNAAISPTIPLNVIKNIRKAHNTSFSAVILVAIGNALGKYMKEAGYEVSQSICCTVPRRANNHPVTKLTNHVTVAQIVLPMERNPTQLEAVQESLSASTDSGLPEMFFRIGKLFGGLWTDVIQKLSIAGEEGNIIFTNLNLYETEQRFRGENKLRFVFGRGRQKIGGNGIIVTSAGCKEGLRLLLQVDEGVVPANQLHAQIFIKYFLQELKSMATGTSI